jgi:hypothetical protein
MFAKKEVGLGTFGAIVSQTHLVTLNCSRLPSDFYYDRWFYSNTSFEAKKWTALKSRPDCYIV